CHTLSYSFVNTLVSLFTLFFFSLMLRPPPTSTLFPYTTLFRSASISAMRATVFACCSLIHSLSMGKPLYSIWVRSSVPGMVTYRKNRPSEGTFWNRASDPDRVRSEEHTSELQSRFDLVCRLLLEKKKSYRTANFQH